MAREACRKAEEESGHLADERLSLVMELGAVKDDFSIFREKASTDKETIEAEFDSSGDTLFNYGYGCCVFLHNIYGSKPHIPDGMSNPSIPLTPEFFSNPRCPPRILPTAAFPKPTKECLRTSSTAAFPELTDERPGTSPAAVREEKIIPMASSAEQDTLAE